jgi:hypothetical protein
MKGNLQVIIRRLCFFFFAVQVLSSPVPVAQAAPEGTVAHGVSNTAPGRQQESLDAALPVCPEDLEEEARARDAEQEAARKQEPKRVRTALNVWNPYQKTDVGERFHRYSGDDDYGPTGGGSVVSEGKPQRTRSGAQPPPRRAVIRSS